MSDGSEVLGWVGGGAGIVTGVVYLGRILVGRVVAREDADKQELAKKLEESQRVVSTIEKTLIGFQHDLTGMRQALDSFARQVEVRALQQDKEIAELRIEVKEQLQQLEQRLRNEMQRLVTPPRRAKT